MVELNLRFKSRPQLALIAAGLLVLGAFEGAPAALAGPPNAIADAVASADRPAKDTARDADRKPADVLAFFGIAPGMTVLDVNSGSGYYSEILSYLVGPKGSVYAHNDELYWGFVQKDLAERYDGRLPNVTQIKADVPKLDLPAGSMDAALLVLAFHDFYYTPESRPKPVDVPAALARIKAALKPGGVFGVVDHAAKPGSPASSGNTLHRIDEALLKKQVLDAGFVLDAESDILRNPDDDRTKSPFTEGLRGKTDRFVLRFKKPE